MSPTKEKLFETNLERDKMKTTIDHKLLCVTQLVQDLQGRNTNDQKSFVLGVLREKTSICMASLRRECDRAHSLLLGMLDQGLVAKTQQDLNLCWTKRTTTFTP